MLGRIEIPPEATEDDIVKGIDEIVKKNWIQSKEYKKELFTTFSSKPLPQALLKNELFRKNIFYIDSLYRAVDNFCYSEFLDNKEVINEACYWNDKGGFCIYLSVLLYGLLIYDGLCSEEDIHLVQGYTQYKPNGVISQMFNVDTITNFHAWLSIKDSVVDISIRQERGYYEFKQGEEIILGEIPEGIKFSGVKETKETVCRYFSKIIDRSNKKNFTLWIKNHSLLALDTTIKGLEYIKKRIEENVSNTDSNGN